jgi:hypothetical protein
VSQALSSGNANDVTGAAHFAIAPKTGTLAWLSAPTVPYPRVALVTVGANGRAEVPIRPDAYAWLRLSKDGKRLATTVSDFGRVGLWTCDLERGTCTSLVLEGEAEAPVWSPDGRRIVFGWLTGGRRYLMVQPSDNSSPARRLVEGDLDPSSITPDGSTVLAVRDTADGDAAGVVAVSLDAPNPQPVPVPGLQEATSAELSQDTHWVAYQWNRLGRSQVFIRPYGRQGGEAPVTADGGSIPVWDPKGNRLLFFVKGATPDEPQFAAADFNMAGEGKPGPVRPLFAFDRRGLDFACAPVRCADVSSNGERFYAFQRTGADLPPITHINLWLSWYATLKARVPVGR